MKHAPALVQLHSMVSRKGIEQQPASRVYAKRINGPWRSLTEATRHCGLKRLTESGPGSGSADGNCRAPGTHVGTQRLGETIAHEARSHSSGKMEVWKSSRDGRLPSGVCLESAWTRRSGQPVAEVGAQLSFGAIWRVNLSQTNSSDPINNPDEMAAARLLKNSQPGFGPRECHRRSARRRCGRQTSSRTAKMPTTTRDGAI